MDISYTYDGVSYIDQGGTVTEAHPALVSLNDEFVLGLSRLHVYFQNIDVAFTRVDMVISDGAKKATVENVPFTDVAEWGTWRHIRTVDHTVDTAGLTLETDSGGTAGIEFIFYSGGFGPHMPYAVIADTGIFPADVCGYAAPTLSAFDVYRSNSTGGTTGDLVCGAYTITSNAAEMQAAKAGYPALLRDAVETVVTFTRNVGGTPVPYSNDISGSGDVLRSQGAALELGNEETFTVTATLTDGINTVSMSALLSANFAIFNANAAKNSIGIGKYCDGTFRGLDVNMAAKFRKAVKFDVSPFEILWVNSNPTSSMAAVNVTMSRAVEEGEFIFSAYRYSNSDDYPRLLAFAFVGVMQMRMTITNSVNNRNGNREIEFTAGSDVAQIGAGFANNATSNSTMIPLFFATLRDFKITSAMLSAWTAPT